MQEEFIHIYGLQFISVIGYLNLLDINVIIASCTQNNLFKQPNEVKSLRSISPDTINFDFVAGNTSESEHQKLIRHRSPRITRCPSYMLRAG